MPAHKHSIDFRHLRGLFALLLHSGKLHRPNFFVCGLAIFGPTPVQVLQKSQIIKHKLSCTR